MLAHGIGKGLERKMTQLVVTIKRALGFIVTENNYIITTEDLRSFKDE